MSLLAAFNGVLFLFLMYKISRLKQQPASIEITVPDKVEGSEQKLDLELLAFRADLDAFGKDQSKQTVPTDAIFKHPLAHIKVDERGFSTPNNYAYGSLLINDAYLHPLVSNEQRERARDFLRAVIGETAFKTVHPQLINRQVTSILQTCTLVATLLEGEQAE